MDKAEIIIGVVSILLRLVALIAILVLFVLYLPIAFALIYTAVMAIGLGMWILAQRKSYEKQGL